MKIHPLFSPEGFTIEALHPCKQSPFVMYCFPGDAELLQYKPKSPVWHIAHLIDGSDQTYPVLYPLSREHARLCLGSLAKCNLEFPYPWTQVPGNEIILEYAIIMANVLSGHQFMVDRLANAGRIAKVSGKDGEWISWESEILTYPETFDTSIPDWVRKQSKHPSIQLFNYDDNTGRNSAIRPPLSIVEFIG